MKDPEAKLQANVGEFIKAAQDLHSAGEPWLYILDVSKQIALNDESYMRRRQIKGRLLKLIGINLNPEPVKWFGVGAAGSLYPVAAKLEGQGILASRWEDRLPEDPNQPRRRIYQLVENPDSLAQAA